MRYHEDYEPDWDYLDRLSAARAEAAEIDAEDAYRRDAQEECEAQARKELGNDAPYEAVDELAREIYRDNIDCYVETCGCSDPGCPCSGPKRGGPP